MQMYGRGDKMACILFSPLGDTDPVRGCYDGAILHILRHYRPIRIVLFYTHDMAEKEHSDHRYTRAIRRTAPDCVIEEIVTDIREAHLYESFSRLLPQAIQKLREENPDKEILINLSSGTPQMKTVLAMLAADTENCVGIQVSAPARTSNRANEATQDAEDIDALLENNFDEEERAENRCEEPPLGVFRYYAERSRILSLIETYEYAAALKIARRSPLVPQAAVTLLTHTAKRSALCTEEAKAVLREYEGKKLFPLSGRAETLVEYFLIMQMDQETGRLSNLMLRMIPFLYEFLRDYVEQNVLSLRELSERRSGAPCLVREKLAERAPNLLTYLDREFSRGYTEQPLSFYILYHVCVYAEEQGLAKNRELHTALMAELVKIRRVRELRNSVAHEVMNVTEELFHAKMGIGSHEAVSAFARMLTLVYGEKVRPLRSLYRDLNTWTCKALEIHA